MKRRVSARRRRGCASPSAPAAASACSTAVCDASEPNSFSTDMGRRLLVPAGRLGQRDRAEQPQRLVVHHHGGVAVTVQCGATGALCTSRARNPRPVPEPVGVAEPQHVPFVTERSVGDPPALVERTDEVLGGHPGIVEEHLVEVEVVLIARRSERPAHHTGQVGGDHQCADALVLRAHPGRCARRSTSTSASWAPDVHTFCPLTTKWSPSAAPPAFAGTPGRSRRPVRSCPATQ